ncbi:MAG: quinoprotein dehydrogenase-associated putative ABC transporter substrate-binding protein [Pseudomonadota bacterium]|nr:quinoprotein dehydrogenase-associated putative ABC transporter substrate-binding protein [Pseudomonadota bacterium]
MTASWFTRNTAAALVGLLVFASLAAGAADPEPPPQDEKPDALRVCQDPNNLPNSNLKGEGFENRIAELLAGKLGVPLQYYSTPQRLGFVRNTLKFKLPGDPHYRCDVVIAAPVNSDQMAVTKPYFRSGEMLVVPADGPLAGLHKAEDLLLQPKDALGKLRIAVYDRDASGGQWLVRHGLEDQGVPYRLMDARPDFHAGEIVDHVLNGEVDAAIVWGPVAGWYARHATGKPLRLLPLAPVDAEHPTVFAMGMGLRYGEPKWKATLQKLIDENRGEIVAILKDYGIPLLDENGQLIP